MRTPTAIIFFGIITLCIIAIRYLVSQKEDKKTSLIAHILFFPLYFGIAAVLINGGSNMVTVVNGTSGSECITKKYFLFYNSHSTALGPNLIFMAPYGKDVIFNNTSTNLICYPIYYGNVKSNETPVYIPAHAIRKVGEKPSTFFRAIPDKIMYYSRYNSPGRTQWALLTEDQKIEYEESFKWLDSYSD